MKFWIISILLFLVLVQSSRQDSIKVYFKFRVAGDGGSYYEPYGLFRIAVAGVGYYTIYNVDKSNSGSVLNGEEKLYTKTIPYTAGTTYVTLKGYIKEDDTGSWGKDDLIGNYEGVNVQIADIKDEYSSYFYGDGSGDWTYVNLKYDYVD